MIKNIVQQHLEIITDIKVEELLNLYEHTFSIITHTIENHELEYFNSKKNYYKLLLEKYYEKTIKNLTFNNIHVLNILYNKYIDSNVYISKIPQSFLKELKDI